MDRKDVLAPCSLIIVVGEVVLAFVLMSWAN